MRMLKLYRYRGAKFFVILRGENVIVRTAWDGGYKAVAKLEEEGVGVGLHG